MHRKLICTIASVAMLAGLLFIGATPAQAAPPTDTQNFQPDDTVDPFGIVGTFLSDKDDGTDQLAHLTNVSTEDTAEVRWFACPEARFTGTGQTVTANSQLNGCTALGTDSTPTSPEDGPGTPPVPDADEAYELFFDISPGLEGPADIVAAACTNAAAPDFEDDPPAGGANDERNCTSDVEDQVILDDASQGIQGAQTSSGEITSFCGVDNDGVPGPVEDGCVLVDGTDAGTEPDPNPAVDANFRPLPHGSNVPNDGFTLRATSSIDVIAAFALITPGDAQTDPGTGASSFDDCEQISTAGESRTWQCSFNDGQVPDDGEFEVSFEEDNNQAGTGGNCTNPAVFCKLDAHYVVSQDRRAESAVLSFARQGSSSDDLDIPLTAGCDDPDTEDANRADFDASHLVGCLSDQFNAPIDGQPTTFESAGVGEVFDGDCDTLHDHNDDLLAEHCHADDSNGEGEYDAEVFSDAGGTQTITFCLDEENGGTDTTPPADHGCADETAVATATKTWTGIPDQVTLVFDDGAGDPCDGPTNLNNRVGNVDDLVACVFDSNGDPASTEPEDNGELQWLIEQGADDFTDTRFTDIPPQETDASGHAVAEIEAVDPGTDNISVVLLDENGDFVDSALVQKQVSAKPRSNVNIKHRTGPHRFKGRVSSTDPTCEPGRTVVVKRRRAGADKTIGSDTTNANGKYTVRHRKTNKKKTYYAKVRGNADCRGDRSRSIRRR